MRVVDEACPGSRLVDPGIISKVVGFWVQVPSLKLYGHSRCLNRLCGVMV